MIKRDRDTQGNKITVLLNILRIVKREKKK
jgi:hypothetical protein